MSTPVINPKDTESSDNANLVLTDAADGSGESKWGWFKSTLPVAIIAAFAELGLAVMNNEFQVYIPKGLGLSMVMMSTVMMPFFIAEVVFKSPLGVLADRYGRKPLMIIGPAISIGTPLILASIHYPPHHIVVPLLLLFGLLRLLDGLGAASLWPAMFAYIGDHVSERKRTSAMSMLNVTYMMGLAFGFLAGGWVNDTFGPVLTGQSSMRKAMHGVYSQMRSNMQHRMAQMHDHRGAHMTMPNLTQMHAQAVAHAAASPITLDHPAQFHPSFYLGSVLFAIATCVAILTLREKGHSPSDHYARESQACGLEEKMTWEGFVQAVKCVPHLMLIALTTFAGMGCIMLLVKNFALDELGIDETQFGLLVLWPALIIGALAIPLGHVSDKVGSVLTVKVGYCIGALGMWLFVALYWFPNLMDIGLVLGAIMIGVGFIMAFPAWMSHLTSLGNRSRRATIVGAVSTAQGVGAVIGAGLGGWLYDHGAGLCVAIGRLFGSSLMPSKHLAHIMPFGASGILLALSAVLTVLLIRQPVKPAEV